MATSPTPPSSSLPQPQSYEALLGQATSSYASALGINDLNVGSANVSFFKVVALMIARSSGDIFQILRDYNLDRATGPALKNLANEYNVPVTGASAATSFVTVTDLSFQKISTLIYAGANPPIAGSTSIFVSDASSFPSSGAIYIGRGSVNVEGPISYSATTQIGSFWQINLSSPTTKFHNISESVILSQGGVRTVPVNTIVISPGIGTTPDVQYSVTQSGIILDGETTVSNIPIVSVLPGSSANVPAGAISQFTGNPTGLPNASVTNPSAITTGQDTETDDQLKINIKNALASTGLGTVTAIESSLEGVQDPNGSDTITSTDILNSATNTTVYIDNGAGLEATHTGVAIETIVNSALGGEKFFQLVTGGKQTSVTKSLLQTIAAEPFNLSGGEILTVVVGNITYEHTFAPSDFANPGSATAYEVCASINADTLLNFEAVTAGGGTFVVIRPEDEVTNRIQVTTPADPSVIDANTVLEFPSQLSETLRLYKNGKLLTEDGSTASIFTQQQSLWSSTLASGETLSISVDGTQPITYTLTDADFVAEGTYTTLSFSNSLQSWTNVFNNVITGITASIVGSTIEITSNLGSIDRAQIDIVNTVSNPTSLIAKGVISINNVSSQGAASDYTLDRNTAQIQLVTALVAGDSLSAGTPITQANIESSEISSGSLTLSSDAHVWIAIDTNAVLIPTVTTGSLISVTLVGNNTVRYTANSASVFSNVIPGDYVIIWSLQLPAGDRLEGRVHANTGNTLDIKVTAAEYAAASASPNNSYISGFAVVRTANVPQKFRVQTGTKTLNAIAIELQSQTDELQFSVVDNTSIKIISNSDDSNGQIVVVTSDTTGSLLNFKSGQNSVSQSALIAYYETQSAQAELPLFFHSTISGDSYANPIDTYVTNFSSTLPVSSFDPNELISFLSPYGGIDDEQPTEETVQMSATVGSAITILPEYPDVRRLRIADRFYIANPLDFGYNDSTVVIVDNNTIGETYTLPLYRNAQTNSTYATNNFSFNAYDTAAGSTASFVSNFSGFDFSNFKALLQAKYVLQGANAQTALLYRSTAWGRSGEYINVAYVYPSSANQAISSSISISPSNNVSAQIILASGNPVLTNTSSNTQWNVTIAANNPTAGIDQVTYTYNGTGNAPNLNLSGGEYVTILPSTGFNVANTGTFRVSTTSGFSPTSTSFTVQRPTGVAVAQSNVVTSVLNGIYFYQASPTTAAQINTYVNANLSNYFTTTIVNDGGTSGYGVIVLSTYEDSGFTTKSYYLKDGINWIASSNVSGSPQFTFKRPLTYASDTGYAFNMGDQVRLVPTTIDQVQRLWSILAVTGFTTVGNVETSDRGTRLQLATNTVGSVGSIQIVGGSGNEYTVPVLTSGELLGNNAMIFSANSIASQAVASDQWFRVAAQNYQNKNVGFGANTSVTVLSNTPISGQSTVILENQTAGQLYFGSPRNFVRVSGDTFRIEKQGALACLSWNGVGSSPNFSTNLNFNDSAGWTLNVDSGGTYSVATGNTNFAALSIGDLINVTGAANAGNNGSFFVEGVTGTSFKVSNPNVVPETGTTIAAGAFTSTSSVSEGDTVILDSPFSPLNQGTYRVIRMFNNSIWYENSNAIEEEIFCAANTISTGYDTSSVFNVVASSGTQTLVWTGTGTSPNLQNVLPGDIVTFGSGFTSANQGSFMATKSGPSQVQIAQFTMPAGSTFASSGAADYFELYNGGNANQYYVWFNVSGGSNTDPAPVGFTGIEVTINSSDSSATVANELYNALNGHLTAINVSVSSNVVTATCTVAAATNIPVNVSMPAAFGFVVTQSGQRSFLSVINPAAVNQSGLSAVTFSVNRPQIEFFQYDATVPGDKLVINGSVLGAGNAGTYQIFEVLSPTTAIITGVVSQQYNTNLSTNSVSLSVQEGHAYTGYKQVKFVAAQPGTTNFNNIVFNTSAQFDKINLSGNVGLTSLGKLNFPTTFRSGIDSYNYDIGLIGEANRVIYGDPRDSITYPGVNAAGTDIFIREPLLKRIQIALAIRTNIGVSFAQITSQIQSTVYALIQSNPLGQSIDLSSIVEAVRAIPGVTSVVITNPAYSVASDEIQLVTGEKAFIANQISDISVSLIGS